MAIQAPTISGCGRNLDSFNINNQAYFSIPNTIQLQDTNVNNNNSSVVNRIRLCAAIECPRTDISVQKTVTPITSIGCGDLADTLEYTVLWVNNGPSAANGVSILDYIDTRNAVYSGGGNASYSFPYDIFGETWYSSSGTSTPSWQFGQSGLTFTHKEICNTLVWQVFQMI
ncbi:MAG: DUF11 domain-containing protein [Bacteroidetes bacterium]|nr:DUF11 domain-containing protein [Bacteroidota bacterium]